MAIMLLYGEQKYSIWLLMFLLLFKQYQMSDVNQVVQLEIVLRPARPLQNIPEPPVTTQHVCVD